MIVLMMMMMTMTQRCLFSSRLKPPNSDQLELQVRLNEAKKDFFHSIRRPVINSEQTLWNIIPYTVTELTAIRDKMEMHIRKIYKSKVKNAFAPIDKQRSEMMAIYDYAVIFRLPSLMPHFHKNN